LADKEEPTLQYTILHCRNPECAQRVWVPANKLGSRGRCPECGRLIETPAEVPAEELFEGPPILQNLDDAVHQAVTV
jgi:hypothetical protein